MMTTRPAAERHADVVVVGAGIIGLATGWRLAQHGLSVALVDPAPGAAATHAAAGMLAPVSEATYGEEHLLALDVESLQRYPGFAAELEAETGHLVGLRREGTLVVATDAGDREQLLELQAFQASLGLSATMLTSRECRAAEPVLSPDVRCGLRVDTDHSIDNRRLAAALLAALDRRGVEIIRDRVASVNVEDGAAAGVRTSAGATIHAPVVLLAAGPWSATIDGVPDGSAPPVRPVKGQILRLGTTPRASLPTRTIRGLVNGQDIYLVPRADGELVVGASVEDVGFDTVIRAGVVRTLLRDARAIMPSLDELELRESLAALRPGSPDNVPLIGTTSTPGLVIASGHHRNGILLAPVTADLVTALVTGTESAQDRELLGLAAPRRFAEAEAGSGAGAGAAR